MNKSLTAATVLLLALSGFLGYRLYVVTHPKETLVKTTPSVKLCPSLPYDYSNVPFDGIINYETAKKMADNYKNDLWKANIWKQDSNPLTEHIESPDARSVWFSLDRLKNFIWHIEKQNCDSGCNETLGLRIYFAKYPDLTDPAQASLGLIGVPGNYSNHHTLFMVPTYKNENGDNVDFYPAGGCRAGFDKAPLYVGNGGENYGTVHAITPTIFLMGTDDDAQNHGGLIPPGAATGTSF